ERARIYAESGGLSGRPLRARSTEVIRHVYRQTRGSLPLIGVGGIFNAADAWERILAGASLIQVYTGLAYEGPCLAKTIVKGLFHENQAQRSPSVFGFLGVGFYRGVHRAICAGRTDRQLVTPSDRPSIGNCSFR